MGNGLIVGTCGFSSPEWIELNYTWYQLIRSEIMERMLERAGEPFYFCTKLPRTMIHEIGNDWSRQARQYLYGIRPLLTSGKLFVALVQLPSSF